VRSKESCPERWHRSDASSGQQNKTIAEVFGDWLFYRDYRRDRWLGVRVRLDYRQGRGVAVSLVLMVEPRETYTLKSLPSVETSAEARTAAKCYCFVRASSVFWQASLS
jgi:hypothetical protein